MKLWHTWTHDDGRSVWQGRQDDGTFVYERRHPDGSREQFARLDEAKGLRGRIGRPARAS